MTQPLAHANRTPAHVADRTLFIVFVPCFLVLGSVALFGHLAGCLWTG